MGLKGEWDAYRAEIQWKREWDRSAAELEELKESRYQELTSFETKENKWDSEKKLYQKKLEEAKQRQDFLIKHFEEERKMTEEDWRVEKSEWEKDKGKAQGLQSWKEDQWIQAQKDAAKAWGEKINEWADREKAEYVEKNPTFLQQREVLTHIALTTSLLVADLPIARLDLPAHHPLQDYRREIRGLQNKIVDFEAQRTLNSQVTFPAS